MKFLISYRSKDFNLSVKFFVRDREDRFGSERDSVRSGWSVIVQRKLVHAGEPRVIKAEVNLKRTYSTAQSLCPIQDTIWADNWL